MYIYLNIFKRKEKNRRSVDRMGEKEEKAHLTAQLSLHSPHQSLIPYPALF
jgi:hypothetical protein